VNFNSRFILAMTLALAAVVAGCATVQPTNAGQAVLDAYRQYTELAEGAAAYGSLPFCDTKPTGVVVCADRELVKQIKVVRDNTEPVIKQAKAAVLDPNFNGSAADRWVVIANNALAALRQICTSNAPGSVCVPVPGTP
jgi:hypothetical protein